MNVWEYVGIAGIIFTSAQLVPQLIKSFKTRQVRDVSFGLCIIVGLSAATWLAYGLHLRETNLVIANAINLVGAVILFALKLRYRDR